MKCDALGCGFIMLPVYVDTATLAANYGVCVVVQGLLVRGADGKVTYRQRGEDLEVSQKLLNIQVRMTCIATTLLNEK